MDLLVLDSDTDFTGKFTFGYGFGQMGKLQISWWGFDNQDDIVFVPLETGYSKLFGANATQNGDKLVNVIAVSAITIATKAPVCCMPAGIARM